MPRASTSTPSRPSPSTLPFDFTSPRSAPPPPPGILPFSPSFRPFSLDSVLAHTPPVSSTPIHRDSDGYFRPKPVFARGGTDTPPPTPSPLGTSTLPLRLRARPSNPSASSTCLPSSSTSPLTPPQSPTKPPHRPSSSRRKHQRSTSVVDGTLHVRAPSSELLSFPVELRASFARTVAGAGAGGGGGERGPGGFAGWLKTVPELSSVQSGDDEIEGGAECHSPTKRAAVAAAQALARLSLHSASPPSSIYSQFEDAPSPDSGSDLFTPEPEPASPESNSSRTASAASDSAHLSPLLELDAFPLPPPRDTTQPTAPLCVSRKPLKRG